MKKRFYVLGNPLVDIDRLPLQMIPELKKKFPDVDFQELDPTEDLPQEKTLNIIDTVIGIDDVKIIEDIDKIVTGRVYSLHDFDLGFNLKLMKKMGRIKGAKIIGVPAHMDQETAMEKVSRKIKRDF